MAKLLGHRLPQEVCRAFDGRDLEGKVGLAYLLATTDPDGTPRPCMLSAGELLAPDDARIRVALWPGTRTAQNLSRGGRALLCYVAPGRVLYVKGRSRPLPPVPGSRLERFEIEVEEVEVDLHPGMPVTGGIRFEVDRTDRPAVAAAWARQIEALSQG